MPTPPLPDELVQATVDMLNACNGNKSAASVALGITRPTLENRLGIAAERGFLSDHRVLAGYMIKRVSETFDKDGAIRSTSIVQAKAPRAYWEAPPGHLVKGISALLDADDRVVQRWVKTRDGAIGNGLVEALQEAFSGYVGAAPAPPAPSGTAADMLTVVPVADLHFGMMSWAAETGEPYDLAIASRTVKAAFDSLISSGPASQGAVIAFIGDLLHQNDQTNRTPTSGHSLDVDGRYPKVLRAAAEALLHIIGAALHRHDSVKLLFVPGNHDPEATAALHLAVSLFYQGNARVQVEPVPAPIIYHRWGKNLFGFAHGDKLPPDRMAHAMAADRPQDWGETTCRRFYHGHFHREGSRTAGGVKCEGVGTPIPKDAYSFAGGWRAERIIRAFHFHAERGETGTTSVFVR